MIDLIIDKLHDTNFVVTILTALAAMATVLTLAMPYVFGDNLERRMKSVSIERNKIRARERERLARGDRIELRQSPKAYMQFIVEQLNLREWLGEEHVRSLLIRAGYRGQAPYIGFLFFRLLAPIAMFTFAMIYIFLILKLQQPLFVKLAMAFAAAWLGMRIPTLFIRNRIARRQLSIRRAFPDALDLLLICVESGMSIEAALKKVSQEIIGQSIPLAEELTLTTAELSYLQERRQAFDNLAKRTDLEGVKAVCTALIQAERYGTPIGTALRVLSQEIRDMRMAEAEKKAAGLPPKLTVPMILFFLPVLFVVILGPAAIQVMAIK
ncbi:MAG TPA: type II secretion system F family protein [Xanthobacteraceae bacterium]|jgi:tight adherence protein C